MRLGGDVSSFVSPAPWPRSTSSAGREAIRRRRVAPGRRPTLMNVELFDFDLPPELIAQVRSSRAMRRGCWSSAPDLAGPDVRDLPTLLRPGDLLVLNDTRVLPTRLSPGAARCRSRSPWSSAEQGVAGGPSRGRRRRLPAGRRGSSFAPDSARRGRGEGEGGRVALASLRARRAALSSALERHGAMPLPPYIRGRAAAMRPTGDDYQTIFARRAGARSPHRPPPCTSRPALIERLDGAGIAHGVRDPPCRPRHLPAGQRRGHGRARDARRAVRGRGRRRPSRSRDARRRRPDRRGRHHRAAHAGDAAADAGGAVEPGAGAPACSSPPATASAPSTCC